MVPIAAPLTSNLGKGPSPKINKGSIIMLSTIPIVLILKGVLLSP